MLRPEWPDEKAERPFPRYVTDGPFLHRLETGTLLMLWSSFGPRGYAIGLARSETARITGPWQQFEKPLWEKDGGHGMLFRTFDGGLLLTLHTPNESPKERPLFVEVEEKADGIVLRDSSEDASAKGRVINEKPLDGMNAIEI